MPNATFTFDPSAEVFAHIIEAANRGRASVPVAIDELGKQLGTIFFNGLTAAIKEVTGITPDDVELEVRTFGFRIVGEGGKLLPINLYVRALRKQKWLGNHRMADGEELPKAEAVAKLACEYIAQLLLDSEFAELNLEYDLKLENAEGAYDTGERARLRIAQRETI